MTERTVMIFPQFDNQKIIDDIRAKYDPLCRLVKPHITLVFPFKSDMSNDLLYRKLVESLKSSHPFSLVLEGISRHNDQYGNYIFLNVMKGSRELIDMHNELYLHIFGKQCDELFIPHMTVGNLDSVEQMEEAYNSVKGIDDRFETIIDKVSVEMIGEHGESIIVIEKKLQYCEEL